MTVSRIFFLFGVVCLNVKQSNAQNCYCTTPGTGAYNCDTSNAGPIPWCILCSQVSRQNCVEDCGCTSSCDLEKQEYDNVACVFDGKMCPNVRAKQSKDIDGHFISGSLAWRATDAENSIEFEIQSTWRLSFVWPVPYETGTYTGPCGFPGLGDIVPIAGQATQSQIMSGDTFTVQAGLDPGASPLQFNLTDPKSHSRLAFGQVRARCSM